MSLYSKLQTIYKKKKKAKETIYSEETKRKTQVNLNKKNQTFMSKLIVGCNSHLINYSVNIAKHLDHMT